MIPRHGRRRRASIGLGLLMLAIEATPLQAHSPDPLLGTTPWGQDQVVGYDWLAGQIPPGWLASAIDAGAADIAASRAARAAVFQRTASAASRIGYGLLNPCPSYGIACMDRSDVPRSFGMWFRPQNYPFDWGQLHWCQGQSSPTNGCYDAENVALDELGHVEMLGHHVNYADESDFTDSVVQYAARSRPKTGWDQHTLGRCDVARLQLEYELLTAATRVSTCLSASTTLTMTPSTTWLRAGTSLTITGALKITESSAVKRLSGDPLAGRTVVLQRRVPGSTTWTTVATLASSASTPGVYSLTYSPTGIYDYRLSFTPSSEGLIASASAAVRIETYFACPGTLRSPGLAIPCL